MKISVITPSFRQLVWLKTCVESVADQEGNFSVEHLVQDGSCDKEFTDWAQEHAPEGWVSEPDNGMYDAINKGFRRAEGDIVAWLNCDEQYLPGALAEVAKFFKNHPDVDIAFGDVVMTAEDGTPLSYRSARVPACGYIRSCHLPTFSAATFIRRKIIDQGHLLDDRWKTIADAVWINGLLRSGFKPGVISKPISVFAATGENLGQSQQAFDEMAEWRKGGGSLPAVRALGWKSYLRLRKLFAGAYAMRPCAIEIHTDSESGRKKRSATVSEKCVGYS